MGKKEIHAKCKYKNAKTIVETSLMENSFRVRYKGDMGIAEKGNKTLRFFLGGMIDFCKIEFQVKKRKKGSLVTLKNRTSKVSGGVIGTSKAEEMFEDAVEGLIEKFRESDIEVNL